MLAEKCWPRLGWRGFCALGCLCVLGCFHAMLVSLSCFLTQKFTSEIACMLFL